MTSTPSADAIGRTRKLVVGAGVRRLDDAHPDDDATAVLIQGDRLTWVGRADDAPGHDERLDLDGWLTPAFVDAHVHATATGLSIDGIQLGGATSLAAALDRVREHAARCDDDPLLGSGWDDTRWPEDRPPHANEVAVAAPGRTVLLERVDGHSCVVDAVTLARADVDALPDVVVRDVDGQPTGWVKEAAAEAVRQRVYAALPDARRHRARQAACRLAASLGIASFHEMGHPGLASLDDALAWARDEWPIDVQVWWAEMDALAGPRHGLRPGGDLFLDGSIGSHTAAVVQPYADLKPALDPAGGRGLLFHDDATVARFFGDATAAGFGAGVHAIGGRAIEQAVAAIEAAAQHHGVASVRACRHRIEHVELPTPGHLERLAALGVVASVQPAFDAAWGGDEALYARRFGPATARETNPLALIHAAGVRMAFGSDSTVTPLDPWGGVVAAERHRGGHSVDRETAWRAHTLGGRHVAHQDDVGPLRPGLRADMAIWDADPMSVDDAAQLATLATFVAGRRVH